MSASARSVVGTVGGTQLRESRYAVLSRVVRLWTAGPFVDVRVTGREHLPATGSAVVACNHPSMLNTLVPWAAVGRNPAVLVVSHAFRVPVLGALLRALGNIPVRRDVVGRWSRRQDHRLDRAASAKAAVDVLAAGGVVQLYPEGKIATARLRRDGVIQDLAPGVVRIARVAGAPIIPFGIRLGWRVGRRGVQHTIRICVGPAITTAGPSDDADVLDEVRTALTALAGRCRGPGDSGDRSAQVRAERSLA